MARHHLRYISYLGYYACIHTGDGELEIWCEGTRPSKGGRGRGNLAALAHLWAMVQTLAVAHGLTHVWCEATESDGRERARRALYRRAGFQDQGATLVYHLNRKPRRPT
jgi:ribosomal protein S18 acetylase RimI-like enzyme